MSSPPVLVRQSNSLTWQHELQFRGHVVVSLETLRVYESSVEIHGKEIECPENCVILVDPHYVEKR
mgnify:CR=1 FL=1